MTRKKFPGWAIALIAVLVIAVLVIVLIGGVAVIGPYNTMVGYDEQVSTAQANIHLSPQYCLICGTNCTIIITYIIEINCIVIINFKV